MTEAPSSSQREEAKKRLVVISLEGLSFHHFFDMRIPPPGVPYIFWVPGRAIEKCIDFNDFGQGTVSTHLFLKIGIRSGMNFKHIAIRSGIYFFRNWYKVGKLFSENWYKAGYTFGKIGIRHGYVFQASMERPSRKSGQVPPGNFHFHLR